MAQSESPTRRIEAEVGQATLDEIRRQVTAQVDELAAPITTASAWIDHYLLIDFGFTPNTPFQPNSIQFYSTSGFLCFKVVDNSPMATLTPILACKYVNVTWDTSTQEAVHVYGFQPKS
jgi:hypothetical protein